MYSVMNDTKWLELQAAMLNMEFESPKWRVSNIKNDYISNWDGGWYYHFSEGGFKDLKWVEIRIDNEKQRIKVLKLIQAINLPGSETEQGFKILGYVNKCEFVNYL